MKLKESNVKIKIEEEADTVVVVTETDMIIVIETTTTTETEITVIPKEEETEIEETTMINHHTIRRMENKNIKRREIKITNKKTEMIEEEITINRNKEKSFQSMTIKCLPCLRRTLRSLLLDKKMINKSVNQKRKKKSKLRRRMLSILVFGRNFNMTTAKNLTKCSSDCCVRSLTKILRRSKLTWANIWKLFPNRESCKRPITAMVVLHSYP